MSYIKPRYNSYHTSTNKKYQLSEISEILHLFYLKELKALQIPFNILLGDAPSVLPQFIKEKKIGGVVADFLPLRIHTEWVNKVAKKLPENVAMCQVDCLHLRLKTLSMSTLYVAKSNCVNYI